MKTFFLFVYVFCTAFSTSTAAPNHLFITIDDMIPLIAQRPYNQPYMHTPNLDGFIAKSLAFKKAYCQVALCQPSRTSFLTGRRPDETLIYNNFDDFRRLAGADWTTLPQHFKNNGYYTVGSGKIFHGGAEENSWDEFRVTYPNRKCREGTDQGNAFVPAAQRDSTEFTGDLPFGSNWCAVDRTVGSPTFEDIKMVENVKEYLTRAQKKWKQNSVPFFIGAGFHKPHRPFRFPKKYLNFYPDVMLPKDTLEKMEPFVGYSKLADFAIDTETKLRDTRRGYYAAITFVDTLIGDLLTHLDNLGLKDSTTVTIVSDHGFHLGEYSLFAKRTNFENSSRVLMVIHDPARPQSHGQITAEVAELVDLYPTLSDLAGLSRPVDDLSGRSLVDIFDEPTRTTGAAALTQVMRRENARDRGSALYDTRYTCDAAWMYWADYVGYALRNKKYRLVVWFKWDQDRQKPFFNQILATQLYRNKFLNDVDQNDHINIACERPVVVDRMTARLKRMVLKTLERRTGICKLK